MCSKDLNEQHTPDIVFLFFTAMFFILMSLLQIHCIYLSCVVYRTKMPSTVFHWQAIFIGNVWRLLFGSQCFQLCSSRCV